MEGQSIFRPGSESVYYYIEVFQVIGGQVEEIFFDDLICCRLVFAAYYGRNIYSPVNGFLYDKSSCFSVCTYYC